MRDDGAYLRDILEAIQMVERYAQRGRETFAADELVQVWMVHHIPIIGEAVRRLSPELRFLHSDVPWSQIAAMRNVLVHDYFQIDLDEVWQTVQHDIPFLRDRVEAMLRELEPPADNEP